MARRRDSDPEIVEPEDAGGWPSRPVLIGLGVAIVFGVVVAVAALVTFARNGGPPVGPGALPGPMTRKEFERLAIGKTPAQVKAAVGPPDRSSGPTAVAMPEWHYYNRVTDPVSGAPIRKLTLLFDWDYSKAVSTQAD